MKLFTKYFLFLLTFITVSQANIPSHTSSYDHGVRYYDPRTSVWQSPDPILNEYMDDKPNGGVFNSKNIGLYTYTYNNPVNLVDPDGNVVYMAERAIDGASLAGHTWLILRPDNPKEFAKVNPNIKLDGSGAFVIRGGPDESFAKTGKGNLIGAIGYGDSTTNFRAREKIEAPDKFKSFEKTWWGGKKEVASKDGISSDTKFISSLVKSAESYSDDLAYHGTAGEYAGILGDVVGKYEEGMDYYNSNSYTAGILKKSGVKDIPDLMGINLDWINLFLRIKNDLFNTKDKLSADHAFIAWLYY